MVTYVSAILLLVVALFCAAYAGAQFQKDGRWMSFSPIIFSVVAGFASLYLAIETGIGRIPTY